MVSACVDHGSQIDGMGKRKGSRWVDPPELRASLSSDFMWDANGREKLKPRKSKDEQTRAEKNEENIPSTKITHPFPSLRTPIPPRSNARTRHDLHHPIICNTRLSVVADEDVGRFQRAMGYSVLFNPCQNSQRMWLAKYTEEREKG